MNLYEILGVNKNSSNEEIKSQYRNKAKSCHPDKGGDKEKFQLLSNAYHILSNPELKQNYDNTGDTDSKEVMFTKFLDANIGQIVSNEALISSNIVELIKAELNNNRSKSVREVSTIQNKVKKLIKLKGSIQNKNSNENKFEFIIKNHITGFEQQIQQHNQVINTMNMFLEMLNEYEFTGTSPKYENYFSAISNMGMTNGLP